MRFSKGIVWLVCSLLCLVLLLPLGQVRADGTIGVTAFQYTTMTDTSTSVPFTNGTVLPRKISSFKILLTQMVKANDPLNQWITLQDSSGEKVDLQVDGPWGGTNGENTFLSVKVNKTLKRNETYTLTVKGGTDGLKDSEGNALPADASITFKTQDVVEYETCSFSTAPELSMMTFTAQQGPFDFSVGTVQPGTEVDLEVTDLDTKQNVIQAQITDDGKSSYTLPKTGAYQLTVRLRIAGPQNWPMGFSVGANELNVPDCGKLPVIDTMMNKANFNIYDSTYRIEPQFRSANEQVKFVQYYLDGKLMQDNIYQPQNHNPDGPFVFQDVNPADLEDGIHTVELYTESSTGQSASSAISHFAVIQHGYLYYDVPPDHWAFRPVEMMSYWDILHGVGAQHFDPSRAITREEFATMVAQTFHYKATSSTYFSDVPNGAWSKPYVDALSQKGLMVGNGSNFGAKLPITRADAATVIGRASKEGNYLWSDHVSTDQASIPRYALPYVAYLMDTSVLHGDEKRNFHPLDPLTRAEAAQILSKYLPW